ncbi:hypothetical protein K439DRAFT_1364693, partial [Ramaria rubella]
LELGVCLNDSLVEFGLKCVCKSQRIPISNSYYSRLLVHKDISLSETTHIFSTFFYSTLVGYASCLQLPLCSHSACFSVSERLLRSSVLDSQG